MMDLQYSREKLEELCRRYHVRKLSVFGSRARGDARADSDLDLLVEFDPDHMPGWEYFTLEHELSDLFKLRVELSTERGLREWARKNAMIDAKPLYFGPRQSVH